MVCALRRLERAAGLDRMTLGWAAQEGWRLPSCWHPRTVSHFSGIFPRHSRCYAFKRSIEDRDDCFKTSLNMKISPLRTGRVCALPNLKRSSFLFAGAVSCLAAALAFPAQCLGAGATPPFESYEAELGTPGGGAVVVSLNAAPTTEFSSPELEASGHAYLRLNVPGQYVEWVNRTGKNITGLNVRA